MGLKAMEPAGIARQYADMDDAAIVAAVRNGDGDAQDYLLDKYKKVVRIKSRAYFLVGADRDDIVQEGMIGLYKAMKDFDADKAPSFRAFAELCITRQIQTAVKMATRRKHQPLNTYVSFNMPAVDGRAKGEFFEGLPAPSKDNPEEMLLNREAKRGMEVQIGASLSAFECRVLAQHLRGCTYAEIAENEVCTAKSVDNALQRVRRKIERARDEL